MKLKTLKDLEIGSGWREDIDIVRTDELRQEAIKWIKEIEKVMEVGGAFDEYSHDGSSDVPNWIKHFFNLTEEDLK